MPLPHTITQGVAAQVATLFEVFTRGKQRLYLSYIYGAITTKQGCTPGYTQSDYKSEGTSHPELVEG